MKRARSKGRMVLDVLTMASASLLAIRSVMNGWLSLQWAAILLVLVALALVLRSLAFKVALTGTLVFLFLLPYAGADRDRLIVLFAAFGALVMAVFGLYLIFRAVFGRDR
ncbi:MAG: hypothetical protein KDC03_24035 [Flavobacteriales bacterium]|nr:hypothetical protein [Flavobacteriales bacterium]